MTISTEKMKGMALKGTESVRCKIDIDKRMSEEIYHFNYLPNDFIYHYVGSKIQKLRIICGNMHRKLKHKAGHEAEVWALYTLAI